MSQPDDASILSSTTTLVPAPAPTPASAPSPSSPPSTSTFAFPPHYSFPPFFTLQPNLTTRASQLASWSGLVQAYCRHHRLFSLLPTDALATPLFHNASLDRRLAPADALAVLAHMTTAEGGRRAEWAVPNATTARLLAKSGGGSSGAAGGGGGGSGSGVIGADAAAAAAAAGKIWVYWRRPEEWAEMLERWVEATGQKGAVLTLYELTRSDAVTRHEWAGMEGDMLRKSLNVLVKKGRAQVFGQGDELGVKFF